jgi:wobble nucleotide-excising tRNase
MALFKERILNELDWNQEESISIFLKSIIDHLENDRRENNIDIQKATFIGDLILKRVDFYSFFFSLEYLEPHYELRQNGKNLDKLSPGEKGALLLVFYLILDKSEIPLVIDQPEDNLDNYSVAKVLVPFIKTAKKHRQIIMITHNPNLAVVADAE